MDTIRVGRFRVCLVLLLSTACADSEVEPEDLSARDLLGVDPTVASRWDAEERAGARRVLGAALVDPPAGGRLEAPPGIGPTGSDRALGAIEALDHERAEADAAPLLLVRAQTELADPIVRFEPIPFDLTAPVPDDPGLIVPRGWEIGARGGWDDLVDRDPQLLLALARAAGHSDGTITVEPAPRAPVAAAYVADDRVLLVNPVLLASLEPREVDGVRSEVNGVRLTDPGGAAPPATGGVIVGSVNPYNFYGSVEECAAAERVRCEACLPSMSCEAETRDAPNGNIECETLAADEGRGYFLLCANLALSIATVADCTRGRTTCVIATAAGDQLSALEANAATIDTPECLAALNECLSSIFGDPDDDYPGPGGPPPPPPRDVTYDCTDCNSDNSCNNDCSCEGPSCGSNNNASCTATCEDDGSDGCTCQSDDSTGSGSGGSCDGCADDSSGGGDDSCSGCSKEDSSSGTEGSSCGSGCDGSGDSSSGDSSSCSSCDSGGDSSSSGSSCSSCDSGGDSSSSGSGCDSSCGSSSDSSSSSGSSCGSCGSSGSGSTSSSSSGSSCGKCQATPSESRVRGGRPSMLAVTIGWGFLPVVVLLAVRRRQRR